MSVEHPAGRVLPDRGDGLYWLACCDCGREWAEKPSGAYAAGSRTCPVRRKWNAERKKGAA